jgi:hypothetical protein
MLCDHGDEGGDDDDDGGGDETHILNTHFIFKIHISFPKYTFHFQNTHFVFNIF